VEWQMAEVEAALALALASLVMLLLSVAVLHDACCNSGVRCVACGILASSLQVQGCLSLGDGNGNYLACCLLQ
jgi:hypothetical protein